MLTGCNPYNGILDNRGADAAFPSMPEFWSAPNRHRLLGKCTWKPATTSSPGWKRWVGFRGQGKYVYPGTTQPLARLSYDGTFPRFEATSPTPPDEAVAYLESRDGKSPSAGLSHKGVHAPFTPAERHRGLYADAAAIPAVLPDTDAAHAGLPAWLREMRRNSDFGVERPYATWPDFRSWYLDYHRTLLAIDDGVGRILATLESKGLLDRTAVLFTSDKVKMGEFVNRKGIYPPLPGADKIQAVEMDDFDASEFKEKTREFQKIFLR